VTAEGEDGGSTTAEESARERSAPLLIVDDDRVLRERLARAFRDRGHEVVTAGDVAEALSVARDARPARAVVDLRMPDGSGLELVRALRGLDEGMEIVVLTAQRFEEHLEAGAILIVDAAQICQTLDVRTP